MKPVLVTGGAGFIGKHLSRELVDARYKVTVVDKVPRPESFPESKFFTYRRQDAFNIGSLELRQFLSTAIVHLAADVSVEKSVMDPVSTVRANIGVTCAALEFARKTDASKFVLASTAAVYGDRADSCSEKDDPSPLSPYAVSKLSAEYYCRLYSKLYGLPTVILRFFNVYGPEQSGEYAGVITRFVQRALHGKPPIIYGDGRQTRDFVYIDDVVNATSIALRKPLRGGTTINIGTGIPVSIRSLANAVLKLMHKQDLRPIHRPPRPGDIKHSLANISIAKRKLNFHPAYNLERGLERTIDWFRGAD